MLGFTRKNQNFEGPFVDFGSLLGSGMCWEVMLYFGMVWHVAIFFGSVFPISIGTPNSPCKLNYLSMEHLNNIYGNVSNFC